MLLLRRKKGESILIGDDIRITVIDCGREGVRLAFDAPRHISILREELSLVEKENKKAVSPKQSNIASLRGALKMFKKKK